MKEDSDHQRKSRGYHRRSDAFNAGFIYGLYKEKRKASQLTKEELETVLKRAVVIGSLTITKKGAVSAFPTKKDIDKYSKK